jgi:purine nucleosidase
MPISPLPLLIDCDPGIDDALALLLAAAAPGLALRAVTCVAGNRPVEQTAPNARRIMDLAGAHGVPVHAGCARPLAQPEPRSNLVHGEDGLGGVALPLHGRVDPRHAVDVLLDALHGAPAGTLHLVALGPLTNLALAELRAPGVLKRAARIDIMGGSADRPGNVTEHAEFNFHCDPLAAHIVLTAGADVQVFGLDVTAQTEMSEAWRASLATLGTPVALAAHAMLQAYAHIDPLLHDACPVAALIDPTLFGGERRRMRVEWRDAASEGRLVTTPADTETAAAGAAANGVGSDASGSWGQGRLITTVDNTRLLALVRDSVARLPLVA